MKNSKGKVLINEFREFIHRGNVMDMAVGIIVGSAFTAIVNSLVKDIINPVLGLITGGIDFADLTITLRKATLTEEALTINYGSFISSIINFILIALVVFWLIKLLNIAKTKMEKVAKKEAEAAPVAPAEPPKPAEDIVLLTEIRDLLKK